MAMFARRTDRERAFEIRECVVKLAVVLQEYAHVRERDVIVFCHRERVRPQRLAVAPVGGLFPRTRAQRGGEADMPPRELIVRMRIKDGEIDGPENLPNVGNVSDERILKPPSKWQLAD